MTKALWNNGIGAVTRGKRKGYTKRDQQMALYRCKVAQFASQEGACGKCNDPMDPKYACWVTAKWQNGLSLARWAHGRDVEFNSETMGFDANPRSPDEILDEYGTANRGHFLIHPRCLRKWRAEAPGSALGGPVWEQEFEKALREGKDQAQAFVRAHERLREKALANLAQARNDPKRMKNWLSKMELDGKEEKLKYTRKRKPGKKKKPLFTPSESDANLRAAQEELQNRPETPLERQSREVLEQYGVKPHP